LMNNIYISIYILVIIIVWASEVHAYICPPAGAVSQDDNDQSTVPKQVIIDRQVVFDYQIV
jgi:hypothetical protein